jgi:hypothetical protein
MPYYSLANDSHADCGSRAYTESLENLAAMYPPYELATADPMVATNAMVVPMMKMIRRP